MPTLKQVIDSSLRSIGVLAAREEASADNTQDALLTLKMMLDSWANQTLLVYALTHESFGLTANASYTIGDGGDFDTVRPTLINALHIDIGDGNKVPIELTDLREWRRVSNEHESRAYPLKAYYEPAYPLATLYLSSPPASLGTLFIVSTKPISDLPSLTSDMEFPPGYERAIRLGLALELAPEYGRPPDQLLVAQYREAINGLKRINSQNRTPSVLQVGDVPGTKGRIYDVNEGP